MKTGRDAERNVGMKGVKRIGRVGCRARERVRLSKGERGMD
jgi:hypothetical protein